MLGMLCLIVEEVALMLFSVQLMLWRTLPLFNAGKGAVFTHDGKNELDAAIMDGKTKMAGAVAGVTTIKNPINAAYAVMTKSPHVLMISNGAELFAKRARLSYG